MTCDDETLATTTERRIEMVKLLGLLRQGDEMPGQTILRALRKLADETPTRHPREIPMPEGFTLLDSGRICHLDDPDCRHPDCDCARYMTKSCATNSARRDHQFADASHDALAQPT